jgi:hypothetical protein
LRPIVSFHRSGCHPDETSLLTESQMVRRPGRNHRSIHLSGRETPLRAERHRPVHGEIVITQIVIAQA